MKLKTFDKSDMRLSLPQNCFKLYDLKISLCIQTGECLHDGRSPSLIKDTTKERTFYSEHLNGLIENNQWNQESRARDPQNLPLNLQTTHNKRSAIYELVQAPQAALNFGG